MPLMIDMLLLLFLQQHEIDIKTPVDLTRQSNQISFFNFNFRYLNCVRQYELKTLLGQEHVNMSNFKVIRVKGRNY